MARTQKNFSVLGDSISTFQGYSPWGAAHYSPDLGAATGVHTVEDTWWMQVIRALQGRLLSNLSHLRQYHLHCRAPWAGFPPRRIAQLTVDGVTPDHILLYAGSTTPIFMCRQKVPPGIPAAALPSSANLSPRTDQLRHIDFGCRSRDSGLPLLSCAAFGPLQPGHPLCRSAGRIVSWWTWPLCIPATMPWTHSIPMELAWRSWPGSGSKEWKLPHRTETFFNFVLFFPLFFALTLSLCYNVICTVNSF